MYKNILLSKVLLLIAIGLAGTTGVWADKTYTIGWGTASGETSKNFTSANGNVEGILSFTSTKNSSTTSPTYNENSNELRLYYSSQGNGGSITIKPAEGVTITSAKITTSTTPSVSYKVDGGNSVSVSQSNSVYSITNITASKSLEIQNSNTSNIQLRIKTIEFTYTKQGLYEITALSNDVSYGTVSIVGSTITAIPSEGYRVSSTNPYQINEGNATVTQDGNVFEVEANSNCTIQINFEAIPQHNVIFNINGQSTLELVREGSSIPFPTVPESFYGLTFVGWTTSAIEGTVNSVSEIITSTSMGLADVTYYALFAKQSTIATPVTRKYGFETGESTSNWNIDGPFITDDYANTGKNSGKINKNNTYVTFKNKVKVTEFSFAFTRGSDNSNYYVYIEASTDKSEWSAVETYPMSSFKSDGTFITKSHTFDGNSELYVRFHCYNTTALRYVDDVTITYNENHIIYSDYCTTVASTATVSIASACTDGDLFYGTYSNTTAFVVPSDLEVYEISILDGEIYKEKYNTGDVVPAKTGVFVAALEAGDYTLNLSNEEGSSVLGEDNMLRPTDKGISALTMAANDSDCMYYRLTMHNGTQIGFYWGAEDGAAFDVAANKAYLAVPIETAGNVRGFNLFGDATAIKDHKSTTAERTTYNIQGQRVSANTKGIVISNGKKYFNK